jgi:predicted ATPase/class 3 adenylate cyclase
MGWDPGASEAGEPVALAVTDVQGSTALWERLGLGFREVLDVHDDVMRAAIAKHGGYEVRTEGDAFVVAFPTATAAIAACLDAQQALHDAPWPSVLASALPDEAHSRGLRVRMGVHFGPALRARDPVTGRWTWTGAAAHHAARIAAAGHGGQVLADEATARAAPEGTAISALGDFLLDGAACPLVQLLPPTLAGRRFPPVRAVRHRRSNVPAPPHALLGRDAELRRLDAAAASGARLLTLVGTAGVGKTRLAVEWAARTSSRWPGGTWFVDASGPRDAEGLRGAISSVFELGEAPTEARLRGALQQRGALLLLLDTLEHVSGAGEAIARWLADVPTVTVLATSRSPLGVAGEELVAIEPLAVSAVDPASSPAVRLFVERATAVAPAFDPGTQLEAIARLVERLDGLPLAIELAAARAAVLSPGQLLGRLERRFDLLRAGGTDRPARQRSLAAALEASWEILSEADRAVLAAASVFRGSFDDAAAAAVVGPGAKASLERLAAVSLVTKPAPGRWKLLETVQQYATSRLPDPLPLETAHGAHYAALALRIASMPRSARREVQMLEVENLLAALTRALARRDAEVAASVAIAATDSLAEREPTDMLASRLDAALALDLSWRHRARLLDRKSQLVVHGPRSAEALPAADAAVAAAERSGDPSVLGKSLVRRAAVHRMLGKADLARADAHAAMAIARGREPRQEWMAIALLAGVDYVTGQWQAAFEGFERAARAALAAGDTMDWAESWANTGIVLSAWGRRREARERYDEVLNAVRPLGARHLEAAVVNGLAAVLALDGMLEAAERAAYDAMALHALLGNRRSHAVALSMLANVLIAGGRLGEAEAKAREALAMHREYANQTFVAQALTVLSAIALEQGRRVAAGQLAAEASELAARIDDPHLKAGADALAAEAGEATAEAHATATAASDALTAMEAWPDVVVARCRQARIALALGDPERARAALEQAEALAREQQMGARTVAGRDLARTRGLLSAPLSSWRPACSEPS